MFASRFANVAEKEAVRSQNCAIIITHPSVDCLGASGGRIENTKG